MYRVFFQMRRVPSTIHMYIYIYYIRIYLRVEHCHPGHVFHAQGCLFFSIKVYCILYVRHGFTCTPEYMLQYAAESMGLMRFPPYHAAPELLYVGVDSDRPGGI